MEKEQIIKALECCSNDECADLECPYYSLKSSVCIEELHKDALSLIREQDKRIEELTEKNERLKATRYMVHKDGSLEMIPSVESVRADTARKMAERLKDRYEFNCNADEDNALYYVDLCEWVERIAKEILEGGENDVHR